MGPPDDGSGTNTILFCDLVASTVRRGMVGEEAADRLMIEFQASSAAAVEAHDGWVVKGTGDGLLASFRSAASAMTAAIALQQASIEPLRVGVSVGDVTWRGGDCFGAPVVEASRLCAAAAGGEILMAELVGLLARGRGDHRVEPLGALELKGIAEAVPTSRLFWERPTRERLEFPRSLRPRVGPFVGRVDELARLEAAWTRAADGEPQLVVIEGEPGVGKTRLAAEFTRRLYERQGAVVLFGAAEEETRQPYQAVAESMRQLGVERLHALVDEDHQAALALLLPEIGPRAAASDPESDRYRLFSSLVAVFDALAAEGPVLWLVDDLQWAGTPMLDLLGHLLRHIADRPLCVTLTRRPTGLRVDGAFARFLADARRGPGVTVLRPGGLNRAEVAELVGDEHAATITARSGGNPFFVAELSRHVAEGEDPASLPDGVLDVVRGRLARLSTEAQLALAVGAVVGQTFDPALVAEVRGQPVLTALGDAVAAQLLEERTAARLLFGFPHALSRDAIYGDLGGAHRMQLHHEVACALERLHPDPTAVTRELALHWFHAAPLGHHDTAVRWCRRAAQEAFDGLGFDEAVAHLQRAASLAGSVRGVDMGDLLVELAIALDGAGQTVEAIDASARAGEIARQRDSPELLVRAALSLSGAGAMWALNRDRRVKRLVADARRVSVPGSLSWARLTAKLAALTAFSVPVEQRRVELERVEAVALAEPDGPGVREFLIDAIWASDPCWPEGAVLRLADELARRCGPHHVRSHHEAVGARRVAAVMSADGEAFRHLHHEAAALGGRSGNRVVAASERQVAANVALLDGDLDTADRLRAEAQAIGGDASPDMIRGNHAFMTTTSCWLRGDFEPAEKLIEPLRDSIGGPNIGAVGAWIDAARGRNDEARSFLAGLTDRDRRFFSATVIAASGLTALTMAATLLQEERLLLLAETLWSQRTEAVFGNPISVQAASSYYKGLVAGALGARERAVTELLHSVEVHRRLRAPLFVAASQAALAEMTADRHLAAEAIGAAERYGAWGIARQARSALT